MGVAVGVLSGVADLPVPPAVRPVHCSTCSCGAKRPEWYRRGADAALLSLRGAVEDTFPASAPLSVGLVLGIIDGCRQEVATWEPPR